jgi:ABC-type amino acid transport substrate-binding protein
LRNLEPSRDSDHYQMHRNPLRAALLLAIVAAWTAAPVLPAGDDTVFALEPEYVWGKNRKPRLGYRKPEVFDPLSDRLYQSGYRDYPPTAIPDELKDAPAMTRVQKMGRILACADGWFWPFSRTARKSEPAGIEIELLQTIAKKHGWEVDMAWVNMVTRFGPGAPGGAYDRSINKGVCDIVLGLAISGDDHHMKPNQLVFTRPFMSTGFVLVTQGPAKAVKSLDEAKAGGVKVGVPAYSPMSEYAQANGIPHATFFQNYQVIDALVQGEVNAAMIWSGAISQARLEHPEAEFEVVKGYVPVPEMRWDSAWVVKEKETDFKKFIDESFEQMLASGEIRRIVERYGMPFYPPLEN